MQAGTLNRELTQLSSKPDPVSISSNLLRRLALCGFIIDLLHGTTLGSTVRHIPGFKMDLL